MSQKSSRADRLFGRVPGDIPEWMAIRDADAKRNSDIQARLRSARLARDASQPGAPTAAATGKRRGKLSKPPAVLSSRHSKSAATR
jgi:hypothetical protein